MPRSAYQPFLPRRIETNIRPREWEGKGEKKITETRVLPSRLIHPLDCDKCSWLIKTKKKEKKGKEGREKRKEKEKGGGRARGSQPRESLNARKTPRPIYIVHLNNTFFTVSKRGVV